MILNKQVGGYKFLARDDLTIGAAMTEVNSWTEQTNGELPFSTPHNYYIRRPWKLWVAVLLLGARWVFKMWIGYHINRRTLASA